jgi:hypothetical protein
MMRYVLASALSLNAASRFESFVHSFLMQVSQPKTVVSADDFLPLFTYVLVSTSLRCLEIYGHSSN